MHLILFFTTIEIQNMELYPNGKLVILLYFSKLLPWENSSPKGAPAVENAVPMSGNNCFASAEDTTISPGPETCIFLFVLLKL
ncbi:MAG TPA: hypothetical protein VGN63_06365 [Flavisolibacter sp.]|nr:hypothetical protein [Flavisolibacter sp.]